MVLAGKVKYNEVHKYENSMIQTEQKFDYRELYVHQK